jgi:hypothetical protein
MFVTYQYIPACGCNLIVTAFCCILVSTTNKMQRYTTFFVTVNALYVSGGFSAHHQEFKNCKHSIWYVPGLLAATASGGSKRSLYEDDRRRINATGMDALRRSAGISKLDRKTNEYSREKNGRARYNIG